jgi:hypothetical protein
MSASVGVWCLYTTKASEPLGIPDPYADCAPFDAKSRCFFINHAVGGSGKPANGIYPGRSVCRYDAALDRFEGNFPGYRQDLGGGEGPCGFVADSTRGLSDLGLCAGRMRPARLGLCR